MQYTAQYPICWPLGRTAKQRSQNRSSCEMREYFWPLSSVMLSLLDATKSL